jgi:stage IV sporulation protein FA
MDYKSVKKYLSKNKDTKGLKKVNHFLVLGVIVLGLLISFKANKENKNFITNFLSANQINFAKINKWYQDNLGNILPLKKEKSTKEVFNEKLEYSNLEEYKSGVKLTTKDNYLVPNINEGIVIFIGDKEEVGNTIIIQSSNEVEYWYSNVENISVNLYDYVSKGEYLGEVKNKTLYLSFYKNNEAQNYKEYLQ